MKKLLILIIVSLIFVSACTKKAVYDSADLDAAVEAIKEAYGEFYGPANSIEATMLEEIMKVKANDVVDFYAEGPLFSTSVDTLIVVIAKNDKIETVKKALTDYKNYLENDAFNYPMNMAKVTASQVVVKGNVIAFIMLGKYDERLEATDDERAVYAKQQIQLGVDALLNSLK